MLTKHIEKIQQRSDSYKKAYSMTISVFVTLLIASVWILSSLSINTDKSTTALENMKDISPASVIKTETAGAIKNILSGNKQDSLVGDEKTSSSSVIVEIGDVELNESQIIVPNE